jgi:PAS domain S-box-containing protein
MAFGRILAVGDGVADALPSSFDPVAVETAADAARHLDAHASAVDCVVAAYDLPDGDGVGLVERLRADHPDLPVVLHPEHGSERVASDAVAAGVTDYVPRSADVDVGERLRAAIRSRPDAAAARRLRRLRRAFPDVGFLVDTDGRCLDVFAGPDTPDHLPDDPDRIRGSHHEAVLPASAADAISAAVDCAVETGATRSVEYRLPDRDDEEWFEARVAPVDAETAVVVTRRITDRKRTRRDLRRKRAHLSQAQEIASFGSWYRDFEAETLWWSETVYDIFGRSPDEDTPTHDLFMSSVHPADRERVRRRWAAATEGEPYDVEHRIRVDGEVRWVREVAELTFDDGRPVEAVGVVHDVTDRKEYERRLETHNERLDVLQRVARHDIRNRMNVVIGCAADLRRAVDPEAGSERAMLLDRIDDAAEQLLDIGRQLRAAEGIVAGDAERRPVDVASLVTDLVAEFAADNPDCEWYVAVPDSLRAWATPAFDLAVANVLENAVEHADADRPRIAVVVDDRRSHVELRVVDDGPGIPEVERAVLVGDRERSQVVHASGLGLWLTRWIVGNAGGRLGLAEGRTGGTVVSVELDPVDGD